jgi:uncharacterized protein YaiI (UPF0178 family)
MGALRFFVTSLRQGLTERERACGSSAAADRIGEEIAGRNLQGESSLLELFVDADGCPVKEEIYRVARRYGLKVFLVANSRMRAPEGEWLEQVTVGPEFDAADDWIAEHVGRDDIVITGDIPLASRCVHQGAKVLGLKGLPFTEDNIGGVLATRDLLAQLREQGAKTRGPDPFAKQDRSRFLQQLDQMIQEIRRRA